MGIQDPDPKTLRSGLSLSNCFMTFTPGPLPFPQEPDPLTFSWKLNPDGTKSFSANGTLFTYLSKANKAMGLAPLQQERVHIPADSSSPAVFSVFYADLQAHVSSNAFAT